MSKRPEEREPDPPYGMGKSLFQETAVLRDIVKYPKEKEQTGIEKIGAGSWYRRVGAVKFRGLSMETWRELTNSGRVQIPLG